MTKLLLGVIVAFIVGIGAAAVTAGIGGDDPQPASATLGTTGTIENAEDVSGPCDEAEHANDPRCTGAGAGTQATAATGTTTTAGVEDVSGPCDEAEHANDPRCTGAGAADDNSGPGNGHEKAEDEPGHGNGHDKADDDHGDRSGSSHDEGDDDRSGSNSGRG